MVALSVIIATYNRADRLRVCLEALGTQTQAPADFEVIVVVDGSSDHTEEMLAKLRTPYALRVIRQPNSGQCVAHNRGVQAARGQFCLFIDDDIVLTSTVVAEHLRLQRARAGVVGIGQLALRIPVQADWFAQGFARAWTAHYEHLNRREVPPSWVDCYGGNMSVPRTAFLEVGGFATDLPRAYDVDLAYRLERNGLSFVYLPGALGYQDERKSFRDLTRDAEQAGMAAVSLWRRQPGMLPQLLGKFNEAPLRVTLLRRLLLRLRFAPRWLDPLGRLLARTPWGDAWYQFAYGYCYWRGVKKTLTPPRLWDRLTYSTPILMYHAVGAPGEQAGRYVIPARRFARHMAWLKWRRYRVISLEEYLRCRWAHRLPPARSVVLTFDDGYADNLAVAYPILCRYGFPATLFIVSGAVGQTNRWDQGSMLTGRPLLSWREIHKLKAGGLTVGAHSQTHVSLARLAPAEIEQEIAGSRQALEQMLGTPVRTFAYPYGVWTPESRAILARTDFLGACGIEPGKNNPSTPLYGLRRVEVYGTDSLFQLELGLTLGAIPRDR